MITVENIVKQKTGSALVVEALESCGVSQIFGYPGACILSLYNELADTNYISHCLCRHEQACVHAAEGYARVSGKVGVVLVTSGPGVTNTVTGIANAYADCTPLLILAGAPNCAEGKVFQNVDFVSMIKNSVKAIFTPSQDENLYETIIESITIANSGKKGPVVVQLTRELLETNYDCCYDKKSPIVKQPNLDEHALTECLTLLKQAKRPLFIVGGGCRDAFDEISQLAKKCMIPVVSTLMGVGSISTETSLYRGMVGVNGNDYANELLFSSDLLLAFGVAFSDRTTCKSELFANGVPVININLEPYKFRNVNIAIELNSDCKDVIARLLKEDISTIQNTIFPYPKVPAKEIFGKMGTGDVLEAINKFTKNIYPIVITDVGQHQMIAAQRFDCLSPKRFITSGGLGTMGFGLPAACGAHFAEPGTRIINITGDGSFQMNIQELATVREYKIPVKIFVMNNGYLGMIRQTQEKLYDGKYYQSKMNNPDFITLAKGYGIKGFRVTSVSQLEDLLPEIFGNDLPIIVDCITNEFETV